MAKAPKQSLTWIQDGFYLGGSTRLDIRQTDDGGFKRLRHATDPFERLPLEHGSDRRENPAKRVSDDLQLSIF